MIELGPFGKKALAASRVQRQAVRLARLVLALEELAGEYQLGYQRADLQADSLVPWLNHQLILNHPWASPA